MPHPAINIPLSPGQSIGHPFIELKLIDSTNNYAMAQVHAGLALHGTVFFAHEQTAGKGQRGKTWTSSARENIMMSIVLKPVFLQASQQFECNMAIALGCMDFLNPLLADSTNIKWPNDLYWRDRKAGGILIENLIRGNEWQYAIAGIGININQTSFEESLLNPVSLKQISGENFDTISLAKGLCSCIDKRWNQLQKKGAGELLKDYNQLLYKKNELVRLKKDNAVFETRIQEVNLQGQLITRDTLERVFNFGEVQWVL